MPDTVYVTRHLDVAITEADVAANLAAKHWRFLYWEDLMQRRDSGEAWEGDEPIVGDPRVTRIVGGSFAGRTCYHFTVTTKGKQWSGDLELIRIERGWLILDDKVVTMLQGQPSPVQDDPMPDWWYENQLMYRAVHGCVTVSDEETD